MIIISYILFRFHQVVWINQPSTLQPYHKWHGQYFLADGPIYKPIITIIVNGNLERIPTNIAVAADYSYYDGIYDNLRTELKSKLLKI